MQPNENAPTPHPLWKDADGWSWTSIVFHALEHLGGTASLAAIYGVVEGHPRTKDRKNWKAKVRQTLQADPANFVRVDKGVWSFVSVHSAEDLVEYESVRLERYPRKKKAES